MLKKKFSTCPVSGQTIEESRLIDIPLKKIIAGFKRTTGAPLDDAQFDEAQIRLDELVMPHDEDAIEAVLATAIPRAVRVTFPKLDLANFRRLLKDPVFLSTPVRVSEEVYLELTEEKKPERFPNIHAKPGTPEYDGEDDMMETHTLDDGTGAYGSPGSPQQAWGDEGSPQRDPSGMPGTKTTVKVPQPSENQGVRLMNRPSKTQLGGNFPSTAYPRTASPPAQADAPPVNEGYMSSLQKALSLANHLQGTNYSELDPLQGIEGVQGGGPQGGQQQQQQQQQQPRGKSREGGLKPLKRDSRAQETDDVIGQLTSLNQDLYGGGGFDQEMPGGLSASFAELSSIGNKDWNAKNGQKGPAGNQRDIAGDAKSLAKQVGYSGDAMADMGNADRTESLAKAGASEQQLRIMNQSNAMLASKLQETEIVRAEVQEDARMKAEQLKALNEERYLLMNEIEREAGIRSELEADSKHKGDELRNVSVEKNLLLMKLQDEAEVKNRLADNLKKKDERMSSLFELNTQLISKFHAQETLKVQLEDELGEKDSHLAELDAEIKTLVGMLKAEENARIKQEADSLTKDEEIHRLSQYNYEVTNKLAEKDRLLKTQGEQLRLMRDRSNQLYAKYSNAEEELQNQGAQLKLLSSHHDSLASRMGAPDIDNDVADMQEFDNVVRRSKGVLQEKPDAQQKNARLPAAAKGPPQGGGGGQNYYNDSAAITTGWKQPGNDQPPNAQYGGPAVSVPDPNQPRPGMPGGGEQGQNYQTTEPMTDNSAAQSNAIGNEGLSNSYESLMQKTNLAQHLTDQLLGNGPAPVAASPAMPTPGNQMGQTNQAGMSPMGQTNQAGMTQMGSPSQTMQQTAPAMPMGGAPQAQAAPQQQQQQQQNFAPIPGVPSAAQPLPDSVIPSPIGNVGGAPSLHGAPVPASLSGGGPQGAQAGSGGFLSTGGHSGQQAKLAGKPMGGTASMSAMGGGGGQTMASTQGMNQTNQSFNNTSSSMPVAESPMPGGGAGMQVQSPGGTVSKLQQQGMPGGGDPDDDGYYDEDEFDEVEAPEPPWLAEDLPSHDLAEMDVPVLPGTSDTSANEFHPEGKVARRDEMSVEGLGEEKVYAGGEPIIEGHIKPSEDVMEPGERLVIPVELEQVVLHHNHAIK